MLQAEDLGKTLLFVATLAAGARASRRLIIAPTWKPLLPRRTGNAEVLILARVALPFIAGYFLSYVYRMVNAVLGPALAGGVRARARRPSGCSRRCTSCRSRCSSCPSGCCSIASGRGA